MEADNHHDTEKLIQRMNRVEGQIGGIKKMLENDSPCDEIIIQLNSARAALQKISQIVLEDHLNHCVIKAIEAGKEPELKSLKRAMDQFTKMA